MTDSAPVVTGPERAAILEAMKKRRKKDYVTFEDLKRAARGTPKDAEELLAAVREHRHEQRRLLGGRRARSTRA